MSLPEPHTPAASLQRWSMLASALAGRSLDMAALVPGEAPWTDGKTVFVDADASPRRQLEAVTVQACLLAAGSLEPRIARRLRRRTVAARYLAVEGHRALAANQELLPPPVRALVDRDSARRTDSPGGSLALARSHAVIGAPPPEFGVIDARKLLAGKKAGPVSAAVGSPVAQHERKALADLEREDRDAGNAVDVFSSPVGGGGTVGRWLQKMLGVVRRLDDGGTPGADAPTHRTRSGTLGAATVAVSSAVSGTGDDETGNRSAGTTYPEWDVHRHRYRPNWCTVHEVAPRPDGAAWLRPSDGYGLRRPLARLGVGLDRYHRQAQGDDVDIDAAVEARVETLAGSAPDEAVYLDSLRRRRDLSVLILLDISGSVAELGAAGQTVHQQQRAAAAALTTALADLGDRVALYGFNSQGRSAVHVLPVKGFDDHLDALAMRRLGALAPGGFSRMGAAIRHGAAVLQARGGTARRLLVVLSDGLAYDHGYERDYGAADARRALAEARRRGNGCLCLSIGAATEVDELRRVFGSAAHATIPRLDQLNQVIGPLFRSALRSADVRRRVA